MEIPTLTISLDARRTLNYFSYSRNERLGCILGIINGNNNYYIEAVLPTDDSTATSTYTVAREPCPYNTLGRVHSHPDGNKCWYTFPNTSVETSDGVSFRRSGYSIDAIVCKDKMVWIDRTGIQQEIPLR